MTVDRKRQPEDPIEVPYLRVANVQRGHLNLDELKTIIVERSKAEALWLEDGDILMNEGGDIDKLGRGWVWRNQVDRCIHQNHVFRARVFVEELNPEFVSSYANVLGAEYFLLSGKQTTNLASISLTKTKALPVPVPPAEEQREIMSTVAKEMSKIEHVQTELEDAEKRSSALRQSILKVAFSGKLRLTDSLESHEAA